MELFLDRVDAGRQLANALSEFAHSPDVVVLGLPRGGVPVAYEVACALGVPLDVLVVRKVGVPGQEELAMGAVANGDVLVCNEPVIDSLGISMAEVRSVAQQKSLEVVERQRLFRAGRAPLEVDDKIVLVIDDGLATGATMRAAVQSLRMRRPRQIIVAVPVASAEAHADLANLADRCVCLQIPEPFHAVGYWYRHFDQVSDATVCSLLERQGRPSVRPSSSVASEY